MSEKLLTIFTPTYNRGDLLERCYEYLLMMVPQMTLKKLCVSG